MSYQAIIVTLALAVIYVVKNFVMLDVAHVIKTNLKLSMA